MCLSAVIWANIKKVYYGNTKEDAAIAGFRDDYIYSFIKKLDGNSNDKNILELKCMDRAETLRTFSKYMEKNDKTIY